MQVNQGTCTHEDLIAVMETFTEKPMLYVCADCGKVIKLEDVPSVGADGREG